MSARDGVLPALGGLAVRSDFSWPDLVKVRRARKSHRCVMIRDNPVEEHTRPDGTAFLRNRYPDRANRFRSWDGGPAPVDHTPTIESGALYVEYFGESPAYQAGKRYCRGCAIAAGIVEAQP
jgi:hypothetical protein